MFYLFSFSPCLCLFGSVSLSFWLFACVSVSLSRSAFLSRVSCLDVSVSLLFSTSVFVSVCFYLFLSCLTPTYHTCGRLIATNISFCLLSLFPISVLFASFSVICFFFVSASFFFVFNLFDAYNVETWSLIFKI